MKSLALLVIVFGIVAHCQETHTPTIATAKGTCNIANVGSNDRIEIKCAIGKEEAQKLIEIVNKILANQIDANLVMTKLNEILAQRQPSQIVNAPNGIGAIDSTLVNPTVNNYGPPPANLTFTEEDATDDTSRKQGYHVLKVHIATDRSIVAAGIGVLFSGPVEIDGQPVLTGALIQMINGGPLINKVTGPVPNGYGFSIDEPTAFMPGMDLVITARSKEAIHVLQVGHINLTTTTK